MIDEINVQVGSTQQMNVRELGQLSRSTHCANNKAQPRNDECETVGATVKNHPLG